VRSMTPRLLLVALAATSVAAGCGGSSTDEGEDPCRPPSLRVEVEEDEPATPGGRIEVVGSDFAEGCLRDDGDPGTIEPLEKVRLFVEQDGDRISVAQVDAAGDDLGFRVTVGVPAGLTPGRARVVALASDESDGDPIARAAFAVAER